MSYIPPQTMRVKTMPADASVLDLAAYDAFVWDALMGPRAASLPDINLFKGRIVRLKHATGGAPLDVTITCHGAQTFDNAVTSLVLANWDGATLLAGDRWYLLASV